MFANFIVWSTALVWMFNFFQTSFSCFERLATLSLPVRIFAGDRHGFEGTPRLCTLEQLQEGIAPTVRERAVSCCRRSLQGSFSAVSKPNFASQYAFESSRRDLHNALLCTALKSHFSKNCWKFSKICETFQKFC